MNGLMTNGQTNLKRSMCIALVGVRPNDKILLKKYLRELIGLKVDIDWVLVSYPKVDLFLIGSEFCNSIVVTKLLADQQDKPVLYVSQDENEQGQVVDDKIFLPLQNLEDFNQWLLNSVAVLIEDTNISTVKVNERSPNINLIIDEDDTVLTKQIAVKDDTLNNATNTKPDRPSSKFTAKLFADNDESQKVIGNDNSIAVSHAHKSQPKTDQYVATINIEDTVERKNTLPIGLSIKKIEGYEKVIAVPEQIQQEVSGFYQMSTGSIVVAIVEPSRGRVWPTQLLNHDSTLSMDWQLHPYTGEPPTGDADDLIQYIWQYSWIYADLLALLIDDERSYQLEYWIKPIIVDSSDSTQGFDKKERQQLLAIMNALELAPSNIKQLSDKTRISIDDTKKIVASLLFSGSLRGIEQLISQPSPSSATELDNAPKPVNIESGHKDNSSKDTASTEQQISNDEIVAEPLTTAKQAKIGFLSRLRSKLGL